MVLLDDGGLEYGGSNNFSRIVVLTLSAPSLGSILASNKLTLEECETCDSVIISNFLCNMTKGAECASVDDRILLNFSQEYFSVPPSFSPALNELKFQLKPYVFGTINISVDLVSDSNQTTRFLLDVSHVNQRPSFVISNSLISVKEVLPGYFQIFTRNGAGDIISSVDTVESQCTSNFCTVNRFASSILPGPNLSQVAATGPAGEDFAEGRQHITFLIFPSNFSSTQIPVLGSDGTLAFNISYLPQEINVFAAVLYDDGGTENGGIDESLLHQFSISVDLYFKAPQFLFGCNPDDDRIYCSSSCILQPNNCSVSIFVEKSCKYCSLEQRCNDGKDCTNVCFLFRSFASEIHPAIRGNQNLKNARQNLSFVITTDVDIEGVFEHNRLPAINAVSGDLSFCLSSELCISKQIFIVYHVVLVDSIGDSPGENVSLQLPFTLSIQQINQRPSFDLRGTSITIWENIKSVNFPSFAVNITKGNLNSSGYECELNQKLTFHISYDLSFFSQIFLDPSDGNLTIFLKPHAYGSTQVRIFLQDDGGTKFDGDPRSEVKVLQIYVAGYYVSIDLKTSMGLHEAIFLIHSLTSELQIESTQIIVPLQETGIKSRCDIYSGLQVWANSSASNVFCFCLPYCKCALDFENSSAIAVSRICLLADNLATLMPITNTSRRFLFNVTASIVRRNFQNTATFDVKNSSLEYVGPSVNDGMLVLEPDFIHNVVEPEHVQIKLNGASDLTFEVLAIGRKSYPGMYPWVFDFQDGGLMNSNPSIESRCFTRRSSESGISSSCSSVLRLQFSPSFNGEVIYSVRFVESNVERNITIGVRLAFSFQRQNVLVSPEQLDVIITNFIVAKFAAALYGALPFEFAVEMRDSIVVRGATIEAASAGFVNSSLHLTIILGKVGIQKFWLHAGDTEFVTAGDSFEVAVLSRNYAPAFEILCSSPDLKCVGDCTSHRSNQSPNCTVIIKIDQNCGQCGMGQGCCLQLHAISYWNQSIGPPIWNESDQKVTFTVSPLFEDKFGHIPFIGIDEKSGNLTLCPSSLSYGRRLYRLDLLDDGNISNGGLNIAVPAYLDVYITPVNQQPSFEINHKFRSILIWASQNQVWNFQNFVLNVSKGYVDTSGQDLEYSQNASFRVYLTNNSVLYDCSNTLLHCPGILNIDIDGSGTLQFQLKARWSGQLVFQTYLEDNGGVYGCGKNISISHNFHVYVVNAYVQFLYLIVPAMLFNSTVIDETRERIAFFLNTYPDVVVFFPNSNESIRSDYLIAPVSGRQLLSIDQQFLSSTPLLKVYVFGFSQNDVKNYYSLGKNISQVILRGDSSVTYANFISAKMYMANFEPYFDLAEGNFESGCNQNFTYNAFLQNITGPRDNPLDFNGSESINFFLRPMRFRPNNYSNWTNDSNGGIFVADPAINVICDPDCTSADLKFVSKIAYNGQVEYSVSMIDRNSNVFAFSRQFTITVGPCFVFPPQLIFQEGEGYTNISCFVEYHFGLVDQSLVPPIPILTSGQENLSTVFLIPPFFQVHGSCVNLAFQIKPFWAGNISLNISAIGIEKTFRMAFLPVNYPPLFTLSRNVVVAPNNECYLHPCSRYDLFTSISTGPQSAFGEIDQLLAFRVDALNASQSSSLFLMSPNITLLRNNNTLSWSAILMFQTVKNRFSETALYFNLSLEDNGTPRKSTSKILGIWIQDVNRAPTFDLSSSVITLFENSSTYIQTRFAQNISAGDEEESKVQSLTFKLDNGRRDWFLSGPDLFSNGTLRFQIHPGIFGVLNMTVMLFDDGGTRWNGTNRSDPRNVRVDIIHINYSPRFCFLPGNQSVVLYESNIVRNETILFASNLVSGPDIEFEQSMTFSILGIEYIGRQEREEVNVNPLKYIYAFIDNTYLPDTVTYAMDSFCNKQNLTLPSKYGYLNFTLDPFRFGDVFIQFMLFDNGGTLGLGKNASDPGFLRISVLPISQAPSFLIAQSQIVATEGIKNQIFNNVFSNISEGGSSVQDSSNIFIFENYSAFNEISGSCYTGANARCSNASGFLMLTPKPFVFGNFSIQVALKTIPHCCDGRGSDTSPWLTINIEILPVNNPPSFTLATENLIVPEGYKVGSSCITSSSIGADTVWEEFIARPGSDFACGAGSEQGILDYSIGGFAYGISLGYHEWTTAYCKFGVDCESQRGEFNVENANFNNSAQIFLRPPLIEFPSGRLNFTLMPYSCGMASFHVTLTDYGAFDGTSKSSASYNLSIQILPVEHPPDFYVHSINIFEDEKFGQFTLVSNITTYGFGAQISYCRSRSPSNTSFLVHFGSISMFDGHPLFDVFGTNGILSFRLKDHMTGEINGSVTAIGIGGMSTSKNFSFVVQSRTQIPLFLMNSSLSTIEVMQASGPHTFEHFVFVLRVESRSSGGFIIINQSNPALLSSGPFISLTGVLTFLPRDDIAGSTTICFVLLDANGVSSSSVFQINVKLIQNIPEFWLSMDQLTFTSKAEKQELDGFVSAFTTQPRYLPSVELVFGLDYSGAIEFSKLRDNRLGKALLLAVDYVESPDGDHLYVAEYTTNTISIWLMQPKNLSFPVQFLDRIQYRELQGPTSIDMSEDGTTIYVSCYFSTAILTLRRDHRNFSCTYGLLTLYRNYSYFGSDMPWALWKAWNGTKVRARFPLAGISTLKVSKDLLNVYAATLSGAIVTFQRNLSTGSLHPLDIFSYKSNQLSGACDLCISGDGSFVFIVAWSDQTVTAFQRDETSGFLLHSDSISNGELLLWRYQAYLDSSINFEVSKGISGEGSSGWSSGHGSAHPLRLGNGYSWANHARASKNFKIDSEFFLAIAASDPDPASSEGSAVVYVWDSNQDKFSLLQTFSLDRRASSIEFFRMNSQGSVRYFLVISNSFLSDGHALNVYLWNSSGRVFNLYVQPSFGELLTNVNTIHYFNIQGKHFLAVTRYPLNEILDDSYSIILLWNDQIVRSSSGSEVTRMVGFELFQKIPGPSSCVKSAKFANRNLLFFTTSKMRSEHIAGTWIGSTLDVYSFEAGSFGLIQSLSAVGVYGLEVFSFSEGDFLALARRQFRKQLSPSDYSAFDGASYIFKWDSATQQLSVFQQLDGESFQTISDVGAPPQKVYEFSFPSNFSSMDEYSQPVNSLRGVTSFKSFSSGGEQYLAVAQSVCDSFAASSTCDMLQPRSTILQFNKVKKVFTEMSTWTKELMDQFYDRDLNQQQPVGHEFPIRVNAGKAVGWDFFAIQGKKFLLALSLNRGAILYRWRFQHVSGLNGASHIVSNHNGSQIYVVGVLDSALVQISQHRRDSLFLLKSQQCIWCLQFSIVHTNKILVSPEVTMHHTDTIRYLNLSSGLGLAGVIKIGLSTSDPWTLMGKSVLVVTIDLPINSRLCANIEDFQTTLHTICPNRISTFKYINLSYTCTSTSFLISAGSLQSDLSEYIQISAGGSLQIDITPFPPGNSKFQIQLLANTYLLNIDGYAGWVFDRNLISNIESSPKNFTVEIISVNKKPSFVPFDIFTTMRPQFCNLTGSVSKICLVSVNESYEYLDVLSIFARNVSAGIGEENQDMFWKFKYSNHELFIDKPSLNFIKLNGFLFGAISFRAHMLVKGKSCFNVTLQDSGSSNHSSGDENESDPKSFCLNLRLAGQVLEISDDFLSIIGSEPKLVMNFVADMQKVDCTLHPPNNIRFTVRVQALHSSDQGNIFSYFKVDMCGNLEIAVWPWIEGRFLVELTRKTNINYIAAAQFLLNATRSYPKHEVCSFGQISSILLYESNSSLSREYIIPNAFNISSLYPILDPSSLLYLSNISSGEELFQSTPILYPNFSLILNLKPFVTGIAVFRFKLRSSVCGSESYFSSVVNVTGGSYFPSFAIMKRVEVVASSYLQTINHFVNLSSSLCIGANCLQYGISWISSDLIFDLPPQIDENGTLTFQTSENAFGVATLQVKLYQYHYSKFEKTSGLVRSTCTLLVHPKLKISKIVPSFGSINGGTFVTLIGIFWIPGLLVDNKDIAVFLGQFGCLNATAYQDDNSIRLEQYPAAHSGQYPMQQISCFTSQGIGLAAVELRVLTDQFIRKLQVQNAYAFVSSLYGGALSSGGGFLALGPQSYDPAIPSDPGSSLQSVSISISGTVLAIDSFQGKVVVAGGFLYVQATKVDHIFSWSGAEIALLGRGLDGTVKSLTNYMGGLVCGGSFTRGFSTEGKTVVSGGLIRWNGIEWSIVGRAFVGSLIHSVKSNGTQLFIAGRHTKTESANLGALAVFDGISWTAVGGGVFGGDIYALAIKDGSIYIGGSFLQAGTTSTGTSKFARWDGSKWLSLGYFDGSIYSIAMVGQRIFVGGDFINGCNLGLSHLVMLDSGVCTSVGNDTLNGAVLAMHLNSGCLYFGGLFRSVGNSCQPTYLGRFCFSADRSRKDFECSLQQVQGAQYLGPAHSITGWGSEK